MNNNKLKYIAMSLSFVLAAVILMGCSPKVNTAPSSTGGTPAGTSTTASTGKTSTTIKTSTNGTTGTTALQILRFHDPVFEKLLKAALNKDSIYPDDLSTYTRMLIGGDHFISLMDPTTPEKNLVLLFGTDIEYDGQRYKGFGTMESLADLANFSKLIDLTITLQPNIDYATLPQNILSQLKLISISQSQTKDISFLAGATSMIRLSLSFGDVSDLTPLKNCKELIYLYGSHNPIEDLSPLANLPKLKSLSFSEANIRDLTPLATISTLESIGFYASKIEDLSPLAGLKNLRELSLIDNNIKDASPLKGFSQFETLNLKGNPIENIEVLDHIKNLKFK